MPPQAAAAVLPDESPEVLPKQETAVEAKTGPESPIEKALEGGTENVVSIFKGRAKEEKAAIERLGQLDTNELAAAPAEAAQVQAANDNAEKSIADAEDLAIKKVAEVIPMTRAKTPEVPKISEVKSEAAPEAATEIAPEAEAVKDAEEQRDIAAELLKEEYEALSGFAKEHGFVIDSSDPNNIKVQESELSKLTKVERSYVYTLVGKHLESNASMRHAEKLLEAYSVPESDPRHVQLMADAQSLAEEAKLKKIAAHIMQEQYVKLPEIAALAGGDNTGGSIGGSDFHPADSPYEKPPSGPIRPAGIVLGYGGDRGGEGLADVTVKDTTVGGGPVEKKPSFIDKWVGGMFSKLTFGWYKSGGGGSRE